MRLLNNEIIIYPQAYAVRPNDKLSKRNFKEGVYIKNTTDPPQIKDRNTTQAVMRLAVSILGGIGVLTPAFFEEPKSNVGVGWPLLPICLGDPVGVRSPVCKG